MDQKEPSNQSCLHSAPVTFMVCVRVCVIVHVHAHMCVCFHLVQSTVFVSVYEGRKEHDVLKIHFPLTFQHNHLLMDFRSSYVFRWLLYFLQMNI